MLIRGTDQTPYGQLLLRTLRNKIIGIFCTPNLNGTVLEKTSNACMHARKQNQ